MNRQKEFYGREGYFRLFAGMNPQFLFAGKAIWAVRKRAV